MPNGFQASHARVVFWGGRLGRPSACQNGADHVTQDAEDAEDADGLLQRGVSERDESSRGIDDNKKARALCVVRVHR